MQPTARGIFLLAFAIASYLVHWLVMDSLPVAGGGIERGNPVLYDSLLAKALLESFALRMPGMISYGVYIYHLPVQNATGRNMKTLALNPVEHWILFGVVSLMLTAFVAALSYSLVELPLQRLVRRSIGLRRRNATMST
jgi:peptidoglycan/LPS O-acetylase OafA/YrhL